MSIWGKLLGGLAGAGLSIALPGVGSFLAPFAGSLIGGLVDSTNTKSDQSQNTNQEDSNNTNQTTSGLGDGLMNVGLNTAMGIMPDIINNIVNKPSPQPNPNNMPNLQSVNPEEFYFKKNVGNSFDLNRYFRKEGEGLFGNLNEKGYFSNTDIGGGVYTDILRRYNNGTY